MTPLETFLLITNIALLGYIFRKWWRERKYAEIEGWEEEGEMGVIEEIFEGREMKKEIEEIEGGKVVGIIYPDSWKKVKIRPVLVEIIPLEEED
jgi:hypothetical protein